MDGMRERLILLIQDAVGGCARHWAELIADHLIANGLAVKNSVERIKFLPCVCGCNKRIEWFRYIEPKGYSYQCRNCDNKAPMGKTKKEAKLNWNKMIEELRREEA